MDSRTVPSNLRAVTADDDDVATEHSRRTSERHATSLALMASEEVNRRILEAMPGGLVHVAANGSILAANAQALRILGIAYDALTNRYTQDFGPETILEDGSPCAASDYPVSRAIITGEPQPPMTIGVRQSDGSLSWAIFTAIPLRSPETHEVSGAIVTFVDITDRKRTEVALQRSEGLLRSVLESAPDVVTTADAEGRLLLVSQPEYESALGSVAWSELIPEHRPIAKAAFENVMKTGRTETYEARGLSGRLWRVNAAPRREAGEVVGVTFVASDISEQRALQAHVAITDRMASIGTLTAGIAHEVNNPLTYVLANVDWAARSSTTDPDTKRRLDAALEGLGRIRSVVSDLSMFSRVDADQKKLLDVHEVIDSAVRMGETETRFRARVVKRYGEVPLLLAAEGRLGQVFLNLIVNAAQALREGEADRNAITITTRTDDDGSLVVEVADTGVGIAPELIERVFDPFVTTKERGAGIGLGLYICRQVVTALAGRLSVESTLGTGTTVRVVLPAATESMGRVPPASPRTAPPTSVRALRVLVADDEEDIAAVVREYLVEHDVHVAHSGRQAIEKLSKQDYDIVFCDLIMGDLTGMDVFEYVRTHRPGHEERIVFVSGGPFTASAHQFVSSVPNACIQKPFTCDDILDAIEHCSVASRG